MITIFIIIASITVGWLLSRITTKPPTYIRYTLTPSTDVIISVGRYEKKDLIKVSEGRKYFHINVGDLESAETLDLMFKYNPKNVNEDGGNTETE